MLAFCPAWIVDDDRGVGYELSCFFAGGTGYWNPVVNALIGFGSPYINLPVPALAGGGIAGTRTRGLMLPKHAL